MLVLSDSIEIDRPAEEAFAYIRHLENYVEWFPGVVQMRAADDLPDGTIGKRYREIALVPPGKEEQVSVAVAEHEDGKRLVIHPDLKPVLPRFTYEVTPLGDNRCRFDWTCEARAKGALMPVAVQVMRLVLRPRLTKALANLKRILEQDPEEALITAAQWRFGPYTEVMRLTTSLPKPTIGADEVLVRQIATSLNHIDAGRMAGYGAAAFKMRKAGGFPLVLGTDVCGIVEAVGSDVTALARGDMVFGAKPPARLGAHSSLVTVKAEHVVPLPTTLEPEQAAALPYTFLTAWSALVGSGGLDPNGQNDARVFVQGGAGGVGAMAVQIARNLGAEVAASCRGDQKDLVRDLGARQVFDFRQEDYAGALMDFDIAFCTAEPSEEERLMSILKADGKALYVTVIHPTLGLIDQHGLVKGLIKGKSLLKQKERAAKIEGRRVVWALFEPNRQALEAMAQWSASGKLRPVIDRVMPFADIMSAYDRLASGEATGKIVLILPAPGQPSNAKPPNSTEETP